MGCAASATNDSSVLEAARKGNLNHLYALMCQKGGNVCDERGITPLMIGATNGNLGVLFMCLKHGAQVNAKDKSGCTALMHASKAGVVFAAWLLLKWNADRTTANEHGDTALSVARSLGLITLQQILEGHEETIDSTFAAEFERSLSAAQLDVRRAEAGVSPSFPSAAAPAVTVASHSAAMASSASNAAGVQSGMSVTWRRSPFRPNKPAARPTKRQITPFWRASLCLPHQSIRPPMGCLPSSEDRRLLEAARKEDLHVVATLLVRTGTAVHDEHGVTPLMIGAARGNLGLVYMCLKNGALVNALDSWRSTALMHAAKMGQLYTAWLLLKWKADLNKENKYGETALSIARVNGHDELQKFLQRFKTRQPIGEPYASKFERKFSRAQLAVKRAEAGVMSHPRLLRRLAWKAGVPDSGLFETAHNRSPKIFRKGAPSPSPLGRNGPPPPRVVSRSPAKASPTRTPRAVTPVNNVQDTLFPAGVMQRTLVNEMLSNIAGGLARIEYSGERKVCMSKHFPPGSLRAHEGSSADPSRLDGKIVGLYFSAKWSPPCQAFTPVLVEKYREIRAAGNPFEIVFVSFDREASSAEEYFGEMPWIMLDYAHRSKPNALAHELGVTGIPSLVILDESGNLLTKDGRSLVQKKPFSEWKRTVEIAALVAAALKARVAAMPETVTISAHEHALEKKARVYTGTFGCDVCHEGGEGWAFHCEPCQFDAHPDCACPLEQSG